jgi:hypothetical protein
MRASACGKFIAASIVLCLSHVRNNACLIYIGYLDIDNHYRTKAHITSLHTTLASLYKLGQPQVALDRPNSNTTYQIYDI